ncbi:transposase [Halanaerobium kushneri]|uniref:REP element-mobilizing transposase RayT n=1 Tax=Halanaerobium kushneri TaxID=56779 RepID=A0A1N6SHV7_9FIRM|nr:transposase [Halanaerobium kushneri]SIQ40698.1 REP element-mobilizing transposase RayT [Halanaerobium kushneri]
MVRKRRVWYPGAKYHITCRGNKKRTIFLDRIDFKIYINIIKEINNKYPFVILSYCLMPNHVHLHLRTEDIEIWKIMQAINWRYARYFNERYNTVGHVFQGRYGSKIIENNYYNLIVNRYIHLNPVKDQLVLNPKDYRWSSYRIYLGEEKSELVKEEEILNYFAGERSLYNKFIMEFI